MEPQTKNWHINLVKDRYHWLKLTLQQAEKIYNYEEDKNTYSEKFHLSIWEESDYEYTEFRKILNPRQLKHYEIRRQEIIKDHEAFLIENDKGKAKDIKYHEGIIKFYKEQHLPKIQKNKFMLILNSVFSSEKPKIDFLKAEYKKFLNDSKMEILTTHFRHSRTFAPNTLTVYLLRHTQTCLWTDYSSFKYSMDESTKAAADHLRTKLLRLPDDMLKPVLDIFNDLAKFYKNNKKAFYKEKQTKGWHIVINKKLSTEEEKELRLMTLLLLD